MFGKGWLKLKNIYIQNKKLLKTKGSFLQNFSFTFTGSVLVILSQIIFAPILSRIYDPSAYGTFSFFNAISSTLVLFATFRYEGALVLEKEEDGLYKLLRGLTLLSLLICSIILLITIVFKMEILEFFNIPNLGNWLYFLGPFVFLNSYSQITGNWIIRNKEFKQSLLINAPTTIGSRIFNIIYGLISKGAAHGLILTEALLKGMQILLRLKILVNKDTFKKLLFKDGQIKDVFNKHKHFPLYDLPGSIFGLLSIQLPIYILSYGFGANAVGQFGFATSLLEMPMRLLGYSIQPVFLQKATEVYYNNPDGLKDITYKLFKKMFLLGVIPFSILIVFGNDIFAFVFGQKWRLAGLFTSYMGCFYLFRLVSEPLISILIVTNEQKVNFRFQVLLFVSRLLVLLLGIWYFEDVKYSILGYGIISALLYFVLVSIILKKVQIRILDILKFTIPLLIAAIGMLLIIRFYFFT